MKLYRQLLLLALTLVVLVSSTGISLGMHLCGGELRDLTFFGAKAECPMEQQKAKLPACHKVPATDNADDCCDDHTLVFSHADATADAKAQLLTKVPDIKFIAALQVVILHFFGAQEALAPVYALYQSPPLARDIPVLVQSFLL